MGALVRVAREARDAVRGRDLPLASAAGTLYAALAAVPTLLVAVFAAQFVLGADTARRYGMSVARSLPDAMGAPAAATALLRAGFSLSPAGVVAAVVMASAYGEGLSRALRRFAPPGEDVKPPAWWLRLVTLPLLGLAPLLLSCFLLAGPVAARLYRESGVLATLGGVVLSFLVVWLLTWLPLTWAYRIVGPGRPDWRAAGVAAVTAGSFVSGFLHGFLLFLSLPVDLGRPFAGLTGVGVVTALLLWLWVLHMVVCAGYALTWAVDAALRRGGLPAPRRAWRVADSAAWSPRH